MFNGLVVIAKVLHFSQFYFYYKMFPYTIISVKFCIIHVFENIISSIEICLLILLDNLVIYIGNKIFKNLIVEIAKDEFIL